MELWTVHKNAYTKRTFLRATKDLKKVLQAKVDLTFKFPRKVADK